MLYPDLHVSLSYHEPGSRGRPVGDLNVDEQDTEAGWFLRAYRNAGYDQVVPFQRVSDERALLIAQSTPFPALADAVRQVNDGAVRARKQRIQNLENDLKRTQEALARLRPQAEAVDADDGSV